MKKALLSLMGIVTVLVLTVGVTNKTEVNSSVITNVMMSEGDGGG